MSIFDRLSQGAGNLQPNDYQDWNQMVGSTPREHFGRTTYDAVRQVDPDDYYRHTQPGIDGTDPFGALPTERRSGLGQSLISELLRRGLGQQDISRGAGISTLDPNRISPHEMAALAQWTQRNQPKAFGRVAAEYQDQPDILSSLLGNKALMMVAGALGAKMLGDQFGRR